MATDSKIAAGSDQIILEENDAIEFSSAIPYYYQLQKYIEEKIKTKRWKHGQKMPSEKALCDKYGVSRTVVRQALNALAAASYIDTYKGKGSFVSSPKVAWQLMQTLRGFYDDAVEKGQTVQTNVLEQKLMPAGRELAEILHLAEEENIIKLHRLRSLDGEPVQIVVSYLPEKLCPGLIDIDFSDKSLYHVLNEKYGFVIFEGVRTIESINAPHDMAVLLGIKNNAALSLIKSVGYLSNGIPLEYYIAWHRGDRSRFVVKLSSQSVERFVFSSRKEVAPSSEDPFVLHEMNKSD
jgi:GntR family transcriptional regulator